MSHAVNDGTRAGRIKPRREHQVLDVLNSTTPILETKAGERAGDCVGVCRKARIGPRVKQDAVAVVVCVMIWIWGGLTAIARIEGAIAAECQCRAKNVPERATIGVVRVI